MLKLSLGFCAIVLLMATACSSQKSMGGNNTPLEEGDGGQQIPSGEVGVDGGTPERCTPVDSSKFLALVGGIWQSFHYGMAQPSCGHDETTNEVSRWYVSFNQIQKNYEVYYTTYGPYPTGVVSCINGGMGSGLKSELSKPIPVELCQTESLVREFGSDYYFLKEKSDFYRLAGTTHDSLGRVVLMLSSMRSTNPDVQNWLEENNPVYPYVNHNDFNSVKVEIP